jgi:hypothetical protein
MAGIWIDLAKTRSGIFFDLGLDHPNHIDGAGVFALIAQ